MNSKTPLRTAEQMIDWLERTFPEPRATSTDTTDDLRWRIAQRQVALMARDAYRRATRSD